jgi:hypothetical protein
MPLSSLFHWLKPRSRRDAEATAELKANAEKALAMKREADAREGSHIPSHQTAHEGMRPANDSHASDATRGAEAGFTPQLKRSRVPRSGDAS